MLFRPRKAWYAAIALAAMAATIGVASPVAADAATRPQTPYFIEWMAGTPLPAVPAGWHLVALPSANVLDGLRDGSTLPMVSPEQAMRKASRFVNLIAEPNIPFCVRSLFRHLGQRTTNVGQSYATVNGITQSFDYGAGQSSSLGIGQSFNNPNGGFSGSGTAGVNTNKNQGFPTSTRKSFNRYQTNFLVDEIKTACPTGTIYDLLPFKWAGGAAVAHPASAPRVSGSNCVPEPNGASWSESRSSATTFGIGWNTFGFNGSAQTGYSNTASIHISFHTNGRLCGTNDVPGGSPGILVAT